MERDIYIYKVYLSIISGSSSPSLFITLICAVECEKEKEKGT